MNRRTFLTGAAGAIRASGQPPARPNILHIMTDQQQWATVGGRSECRTPNLDRLARSGMSFERSHCPTAPCCPVRAMILSGAYQWHNGVYNQVHSAPSVKRDMDPDVVLYSQRLREAGYHLGYVGKWHASYLRLPADFGFHEVADLSYIPESLRSKVDDNPDRVARSKEKLKNVVTRSASWPGSQRPSPMWGYGVGPEEATHEYYRTDVAIRMLRRFVQKSQPWLLEVHFDGGTTLKKYLDRYDSRAIPVPKSFYDTFRGKPGLYRREAESRGPMTEEDYRQGRAHYYAGWEHVDAQIGRILAELDTSGQSEHTMVVFTSDHGRMVGAHRMWEHSMPYEEVARVPLIIRWPGVIKPGSTTPRLVQTHSLAHTYVAAAGARRLPYQDGVDLRPLFERPDRSDWPEEVLGAWYGGEYLYTHRTCLTERFKYMFNGFDFDEMYDLEADPEELHNLVDEPRYRAHVDDMRARLYSLMAKFEDPYGDVKARNSVGEPPNQWGAPRYLPRGKRIG